MLLCFRLFPMGRLLYYIFWKSIQKMRGQQPLQRLRTQLLMADRCPREGICRPPKSAPTWSSQRRPTAQALHSLLLNGSALSTADTSQA